MRESLALVAPCLMTAACAQILGISDADLPIRSGAGAMSADAAEARLDATEKEPAEASTGGLGAQDGTSRADQPDSSAEGNAAPAADGSPAMSAEASIDSNSVPSDASFAGKDVENCGSCTTDGSVCDSGQCVVTRGPTLVPTGTFFIDATEVTVAEYAQFLQEKENDTSGQPSICSWNTSYWDRTNPMSQPNTLPITRVDWCDALAYCTWAGKHLCGHVGGGPLDISQAFNGNVDQWFLACGGPNAASHPNSAAVCNNAASGSGALVPVGSTHGCQGFDAGVVDLEGNAAEWIDSCNAQRGATDNCYLMGGSYVDQPTSCMVTYGYPRNTLDPRFGFRCCGG
jgi:sulfatase modifying factor 1